MKILAPPFRKAAHRYLRRFHQQETQQRVALLADVSQPSPIPARLLRRHQSQIARDLLATLKPLRSPNDQHKGERRQRTDPGMRPQSPRLGIFLRFLLDGLRQLRNRRAQSVQQLQQITSPPAGPVPQISVFPARHPDLRKAIFHYQLQNQLRILAIRLLLAYPLGTDHGRVPDPQLEVQLRQQSFKPARMPAGFHPYTHLHSLGREIAVELLRLLAVLQSLLPAFAGFGIHKRNLLEARMVVTPYNPHVRLLSPGPWLVGTTKAYSGLRSRHCYGINYTHLSITDGWTRCDPNRKRSKFECNGLIYKRVCQEHFSPSAGCGGL